MVVSIDSYMVVRSLLISKHMGVYAQGRVGQYFYSYRYNYYNFQIVKGAIIKVEQKNIINIISFLE